MTVNLPGTSGPALCAVCGAELVADEGRETGWRCPREGEHGVPDDAVHVVPLGDSVGHEESDDCVCGPDVEWADGVLVVTHHSLDRRGDENG